jgi:hypothetical protein
VASTGMGSVVIPMALLAAAMPGGATSAKRADRLLDVAAVPKKSIS